MTVKSLTKEQKTVIVEGHLYSRIPIKKLSKTFGVCDRTVSRVLVEAGVKAPPKPRMTPEQKECLSIIKSYNLSPIQLEMILAQHHQPQQLVQGYLNNCSAKQLAGILYKRMLGQPYQIPLQLQAPSHNANASH